MIIITGPLEKLVKYKFASYAIELDHSMVEMGSKTTLSCYLNLFNVVFNSTIWLQYWLQEFWLKVCAKISREDNSVDLDSRQ